jgi:hypothetical protein
VRSRVIQVAPSMCTMTLTLGQPMYDNAFDPFWSLDEKIGTEKYIHNIFFRNTNWYLINDVNVWYPRIFIGNSVETTNIA